MNLKKKTDKKSRKTQQRKALTIKTQVTAGGDWVPIWWTSNDCHSANPGVGCREI